MRCAGASDGNAQGPRHRMASSRAWCESCAEDYCSSCKPGPLHGSTEDEQEQDTLMGEPAEPNHSAVDISSSRTLEQSKKMWRRVEDTGLLANIVPLLDAENLARAGSVSRVWRAAALNDRELWLQVCSTFPLLVEIKAEAWCELSYRQLFVQMKEADYTAERAKEPSHKAFGPALRHEYFGAVPLDAGIQDGR